MHSLSGKTIMLLVLLVGAAPLTAGALERMDQEALARVSAGIFQPLDALETEFLAEEAENILEIPRRADVDDQRLFNEIILLQNRLAQKEVLDRPVDRTPIIDADRLLADLRRQLELLRQGQAPDTTRFPYPEGAERLVTGYLTDDNH